jgi:transposase
MKKYSIELREEQRHALKQMLSKGSAPARQIKHAHILLKADSSEGGANWSDEQIQEAFGGGLSTILRVRRRFVENGLEDALTRRPQPPRPEKRILNGKHEAYLIALACGEKPQGRTRWSVRLLAHKMVEVGYMEQVGRETIRVTLKKMHSNHG